jgi:hypothetical protein
MDYKIHIGSALNPQRKTVRKTDIVRDVLTEMNVPFTDGSVSLNGSVLGTSELNKSMEELNIKNDDFIVVSSKQNSGQKGC